MTFAAAAWGADGASAARGGGIHLPQGPGVNLGYANCRTCHDLQYVSDAKGLLPAQWKAVIASMRDYGLTISDDDASRVLDYLTTYLGPNPPPAAPAHAAGAPASGSGSTSTSGAQVAGSSVRPAGSQVFADNCATCHGTEGQGQAGYYPPLAGNPDLGRDPLFPVKVVLHGITGPIEVEGKHYDSAMPAFDHLSDAEVAAVVNYVRGDFGAKTPTQAVDAAAVAKQRGKAMSPSDVHAYRAGMR